MSAYEEYLRQKKRISGLKNKREQERAVRIALSVGVVAVVCGVIFFTVRHNQRRQAVDAGARAEVMQGMPDMEVDLLSISEYARPGTAIEKVKGIVIHYTANPGTGAKQNRDYFEGLKDSKITKASSHFVIGLEGEIVQCIPTKEIAYASNQRNADTISIECCHEDESGKFNTRTYEKAVELTACLLKKFNLETEDILRHYDVTGKNCPLYYVENEGEWEQFKKDVGDYADKG